MRLLVPPWPQFGEVLQLFLLLRRQLHQRSRRTVVKFWVALRRSGRSSRGGVLHMDGDVLQGLVQVKLHLCGDWREQLQNNFNRFPLIGLRGGAM